MDTALVLDKLISGAQYSGVPGSTESEYNALLWEDVRPKPTWQQILNAWPAVNLENYKNKKFNDLNFKIIDKLMYVKKIKKLDDVRSLFIDEYAKTQTSLAEVDASIALIESGLFEV